MTLVGVRGSTYSMLGESAHTHAPTHMNPAKPLATVLDLIYLVNLQWNAIHYSYAKSQFK